MMFVKRRKLRKLLIGNWDGDLIFKAMEINKIEYTLEKLPDATNLAERAAPLCETYKWNPNTCLISWARQYKGLRIMLLVNDIKLEDWIAMINKVTGLKAFL